MRHLFDPSLWPVIFSKKTKALYIQFKDTFKSRRYRSRFAYFWWFLTHRKKNSLIGRVLRWKKPEIFNFGFFIFLLKSKDKPLSFKLGILIIPVALLLTIGALLGYPILKEYKANRFAKTALAALQNQEYSTALLTAQSAHLMKEGDVEILRSLVQASKALMHPRYLEWCLKLANHKESTNEDKLNYLRACVATGQNLEARDWLRTQQWNRSSSEELVYLRCVLLSRMDEEGKFQAYELAKRTLERYPDSIQLSSFLWDMCLNSGQVYLLEEGISHLRSSADSSNAVISRAAIRRLLRSQNGSVEERKEWAEKLWKFKDSTLQETILAMNAVYAGKNISLEKLMFILEKDFGTLTDSQTRLQMIDLLNQVGRKDLARELMHLETTSSSMEEEDVIEKILTSMVLEDQQAVRNLLYESEDLLSHQVRRFLNYMFKRKINSPIEEEEIDRILATARNQDLEIMQRFLFLFKDPDCIVRFVEELEKRSQNHAGIKYILATCYRRLNRGEDLEKTLLRTRMPEKVSNFSGELQTCLLKTLYGQELNNCRKWAEDAVGQNPANLSARYALALCYLKKQENFNALATIGPLLKASPPRCPTQRLIGAAVLTEANGYELAKKWLPSEHKSLLISPEKDLFQKILKEIE